MSKTYQKRDEKLFKNRYYGIKLHDFFYKLKKNIQNHKGNENRNSKRQHFKKNKLYTNIAIFKFVETFKIKCFFQPYVQI